MPADAVGGRARACMRQALAGLLWSQAVLPLRRRATGSRAIRRSRRRPPERARRAATTSGRTSTTPTSSRCRTSGSTRGTPPGTSRSTASRSRWSTRTSPRSSSSLLLREWYMHPNGQIPAYEWAFGDVNPPVHAWAAWRVYKIEKKRTRHAATARSSSASSTSCCSTSPGGSTARTPRARTSSRAASSASTTSASSTARRRCRPAGTSSSRTARAGWAMYCLNMLAIALELARENPAYEDVASKFFEHFVYIAHAMNNRGGDGHRACGTRRTASSTTCCTCRTASAMPMKVRSHGRADPALRGRDARAGDASTGCPASSGGWSGSSRTGRTSREHVACMRTPGDGRAAAAGDRRPRAAARACCRCMLDESEFLSPLRHPRAVARPPRRTRTCCDVDGAEHRVDYEPAESTHGPVRRQLELARADLVPGQLSC